MSRPLQSRLSQPRGAQSRVHFIQNAWGGSREMLSRADARVRIGIDNANPQIGWIGRLSYEKAPDVLLDAMLDLPRNVELTFIGDGPERRKLEQRAAQLGVQQRVRFAGAIDNAASLLAAFDVFALSSRTEGTPIVLFEALAARVPVVATRVGGVPDVVDEASARLVSAESPLALAQAIADMLEDTNGCAQRAEAGWQRLQQQFSLDRWIEQHLSLYNRVGRKVEAA